jgi:hypothetical protein
LFFPFHMSDHHLARGLSLSLAHDSGIHSLLTPETRLLYQYSQGRRSEKKARGAGNFIRAHWIYFELKSRFVDIQGASAGYEEPV